MSDGNIKTTDWGDLRRRLWNASLLLDGASCNLNSAIMSDMSHEGMLAVREAHGLLGAIEEDGTREHNAAVELRSKLASARLRIAELEGKARE